MTLCGRRATSVVGSVALLLAIAGAVAGSAVAHRGALVVVFALLLVVAAIGMRANLRARVVLDGSRLHVLKTFGWAPVVDLDRLTVVRETCPSADTAPERLRVTWLDLEDDSGAAVRISLSSIHPRERLYGEIAARIDAGATARPLDLGERTLRSLERGRRRSADTG